MKGFTLTELLGVIIVLGVIALITFPIINNTIKENKEKLYNTQLDEIKSSAEKWAYSNLNMLPSNENESITVTLLELKKAGFVPIDSRNPKTGELLPNDMAITITLKNNNYEIFVDGDSGSDLSNEFNENAPTIILNGNYINYVEINSSYEEKGAKAISKDGNEVVVNITYQENGSEIGNIDVTKFSTYTVIYSATSNGYTSRITRTVVVRDTTAPNLIVPDTVELTKDQLSSFNLLEGVSVSDNSGETINIETRGFDRLPTDKIIEYKACDSHNNCTIKRRLLKIKEDIPQNIVMKDLDILIEKSNDSTSKYKNYNNSYKFLNYSPMYFDKSGTRVGMAAMGFIDINFNYDTENYIYDFTSIGGTLNLKVNYVVAGASANIRLLPLYDSVKSNNTQQLNWQLINATNNINNFETWFLATKSNFSMKLDIPKNTTNECQKYAYKFHLQAFQSENINTDDLNNGTIDTGFDDYDGNLRINNLIKPMYFSDEESVYFYILVPPVGKTALSCNNTI